MPGPLIMALDIATVTGWAKGRPGEVPDCGSLRFAKASASDNAVFAGCLKWLSAELEPKPRPDILIVESMLPPEANVGKTSREVRDRLAGLHGVVRAVAFMRGIYEIQEAGVGAVRGHFIHNPQLKRDAAKAEVMRVCKALRWPVDDHNAGDAAALWHFACSIVDPDQALMVSPLFNKALRASA